MTLQAYSRGLLTFAPDTMQEERWELREALVLGEMERMQLVDLYRLRYMDESILSVTSSSSSEFRKHNKTALDYYRQLLSLTVPWQKSGSNQKTMDNYHQLITKWKTLFGDPEDPEVKKKIDNTVKWLEGM